MKSPHLQLVDLVVELGPDPLPVTVLGLQLLQLHLHLSRSRRIIRPPMS